MSQRDSIETWDALKAFGFGPNPESNWSEIRPGLVFDFGNFKLAAHAFMNMRFQPVVSFSGVLSTPRSLAEVCFELPRMLASRELCAVFLAYYLDNAAADGVFHPARDFGWLLEGRNHRHLLPWEVERAAYKARAHCTVQRDWLRLVLKTLAEHVAKAEDTD